MILSRLKEIKEKKVIASFYTDKVNKNKFFVGYVEECSEELTVIAMISPNGLSNGFVLIRTEDILKIKTNTVYEKRVDVLRDHYKAEYERFTSPVDNFIVGLLLFAKKNQHVVSLELKDCEIKDIQGRVKIVNNEYCTVFQIADFGEFDGEKKINLSNITKIYCNSEDEVILKVLNTLRKTNTYLGTV